MNDYNKLPYEAKNEYLRIFRSGVPKSRIKVLGGVNGIPYKVIEVQNSGYETLATNDNVVGWGDHLQDKSGNYLN